MGTNEIAQPTAAVLNGTSRMTVAEWFRAKSMTRTYESYLKAGKLWLAEWTGEDREAVPGEYREEGVDVPEVRSVFSNVFDTIGEHTPTALRMFTAFKCDHQGKGFATAEGLRSAFKSYFEL